MKAILISIQPKWVELIANGKKMIEVRKSHPKLETPFKVYIYETNWCDNTYWKHQHKGRLGKVIGEFVCDRIDKIGKRGINNNFDYCYLSLNEWGNDNIEIEITDIQKSCISKNELNLYGANYPCLYAWHISDLKIYNKPKEFSDLIRICPEWEKGKITDKCYSCNHYFKNYEECFVGCDVEGELPITRPPQSWCYVEEK